MGSVLRHLSPQLTPVPRACCKRTGPVWFHLKRPYSCEDTKGRRPVDLELPRGPSPIRPPPSLAHWAFVLHQSHCTPGQSLFHYGNVILEFHWDESLNMEFAGLLSPQETLYFYWFMDCNAPFVLKIICKCRTFSTGIAGSMCAIFQIAFLIYF